MNKIEDYENYQNFKESKLGEEKKHTDMEMNPSVGFFTRAKVFVEKKNILDANLGTIRGHYTSIKMFFKNIFNYVRSFFTRRKLEQIKSVFIYDYSNEPYEKSEQNKKIVQ